MAIERKGPQTGKSLKSLPRLAYDRLRTRHAAEDILDEFVSSGVDPSEARRAVNRGIENLYTTRRGRARRAWITGILVFLVSLALSIVSFVGAHTGGGPGLYVVFYGAVFGGIAEMFHAWVLTPRPPTYLEGP